MGFASILEELLLEKKLDQELKYANIIFNSALRMKSLINSLLEYSHIGKHGDIKAIDCNQILSELEIDLNSKICENDCSISYDDLPIIKGNENDIRRLFLNLLTNAIKFRKVNTPVIIKITSKKEDGFFEFSVKDNGIGIDEKNFESIFEMLTRVETYVEGYGIGLASCKKIINNHGGDIWVKSDSKTGSSFYFTIRDSNQANL